MAEKKRVEGALAADELLKWSDEPTPIYANMVQIANSPSDFIVAFGEVRKFQDGTDHMKRFGASIRMTPDTFFRMVGAVVEAWNKFAAMAPGAPELEIGIRKVEGTEDTNVDGKDDGKDER